MNAPRHLVGLDCVSQYDAILDARSPAEFAEDRLPGAINCPVLDNAERARVGTLYVQDSPFEARKVGAALVFRNIARHVETLLHEKPRDWRPLVYCWRGGQRSGAFTWALRQIGWDAAQLIGGYKSHRRAVVEALRELPGRFDYRVITGPTGSGKTLLLHALREAGAQALDLEGLACHRGSVLGSLPGVAQPGQKWFETTLHQTLCAFDADRPVFVEAESRKIGRIELPETLLAHLRKSPCIQLDTAREARLQYLLRDYAHLGHEPAALQDKLGVLRGLHSNEILQRWMDYAATGALPALFDELIARHYDPLYARSQGRNFAALPHALTLRLETLDAPALAAAARALITNEAAAR